MLGKMLLSLLTLMFLFRQVDSGAQKTAPIAPGKMVDLGGRKLHLYCTGKGSPTVILEAGAGSFSIDWALVQPTIAKTTRVCSYDRAGYGWSDSGPEWHTVNQVEHDLALALKNEGERVPYLLAGHSMGGLFMRWFQHQHADEVVGMVLIEAYETSAPVNGKHVPLYDLSKEELQANLPPPSSLKKPPIPTEIHPPFDKLPADLQKTHLWLDQRFFASVDFNKGPAMMESWREGLVTLHQASLKPDSLHGIPLIIIIREGAMSEEVEQQKALVHLSRNAEFQVAEHSGHFVQLERPDLVIADIGKAVTAARRKGD